MTQIYESDIEEYCINLFKELGFRYMSPEAQEIERGDYSEVLMNNILFNSIKKLNPNVSLNLLNDALKKIKNLNQEDLVHANEEFHRMLTHGIKTEYSENGISRGVRIKLIDFDEPSNNEFIVTNQYTVLQDRINKRPDLVLLINGIPVVVIELKNPADEKATVYKAFTQLQNYKKAIKDLFKYNAILVASDGIEANAGSLTADYSRFAAWKKRDKEDKSANNIPEIDVLINEMLNRDTLLDLIQNFIVFQKTKEEKNGLTQIKTIKILAAYHQYYVVNKALFETLRASGQRPFSLSLDEQEKFDDKKIGVVWHTQGSGKSLSMVFYTGKVVQQLNNPTVVVITDRNDLDQQLFDTFADCKNLLGQEPTLIENRSELKENLKTEGGGIIFTTIQKFFPDEGKTSVDLLSNRNNIIVLADEAHRTHYGFQAKTIIKGDQAITKYGFAKYLRDALPNASYIGFTGTPIEKIDASTRKVFGNEIDTYDFAQAISDHSTVPIFYESRLISIGLKEEEKEQVNEELEEVTEGEEETVKQKTKTRWSRMEALVGQRKRLKDLATDFVKHFELRNDAAEQKAMIVTMSRRIAVDLYEEIINLRPDWDNKDISKGTIKIIMTSSSSDPESWQKHHTTKEDRKMLAGRFKDPSDSFKIVIVRDMWLTGFDAPCLKTMYIDKPMKGHNLMQAIARVNRIYKDIQAGLIVDYYGIASDLKDAIKTYTESGGKGNPIEDQKAAVKLLREKYEIVCQILHNFNYKDFFTADTGRKMSLILETQNFVCSLNDGKERFIKAVTILSQVFALAVPDPEALSLKDEIGFFQAVKARLVKFKEGNSDKSTEEIDSAVKQIIDKHLVSGGVIDIFDAAGIKKPEVSILSDEFLEEIRGMERKNLAIELLRKILNDQIKLRLKKNFMQSKKFSEMLEKTILKYQNNLITSTQVIDEIINIAKSFNEEIRQKLTVTINGQEKKLTEEEIAFYDALASNQSAVDVLGNNTLREMAQLLADNIKKNATIDWTIKENVRAKLRTIIKRTLRKYGYPPDEQKLAVDFILKQAEYMADEWATNSVESRN